MEIYRKNNIQCINCNEKGHTCKQCKQPTTSHGIIVFKINNNEPQYLMIQRRNTFHYVEFIRGKYETYNTTYLNSMFKGMTKEERNNILKGDFEYLWNSFWLNKRQDKYNKEYINSKAKYYELLNSNTGNLLMTLDKNNEIIWDSPEWGFPKGRRNIGENDLICAKREFEEETGLKSNDYKIILNDETFEELFFGTNGIKYKHSYYIGNCSNDTIVSINKKDNMQMAEVSDIRWMSFVECIEKIRPYNTEKRELLEKINKLIVQLIENQEDF